MLTGFIRTWPVCVVKCNTKRNSVTYVFLLTENYTGAGKGQRGAPTTTPNTAHLAGHRKTACTLQTALLGKWIILNRENFCVLMGYLVLRVFLVFIHRY